MAISPYCIPCEQHNCWIEIDVRDEQNRSFKGQKATLTDETGKTQTVTLKDGPTLVEGFAVGPVTVKLETQPWLKAAQSREALKEGETSQVPAYTEKFWGHCDVKRKHVKVTTGDLCLTDPEQPLPEGHKAGQAQPSQEGQKAGQAQPPRFITKHSYVIEVKGYQLTTLRIGVFFDGTSNNTFNHEKGKNALEAALAKCSPQEQAALLEQCFEGTLPGGLNNSEKNDITNIGKAHLGFGLSLDLGLPCLPDLPLGIEQGRKIHPARLVAGQRSLESQFGLRQQAGRCQHLGPASGLETGQVFGQFAQDLIGGGVTTGLGCGQHGFRLPLLRPAGTLLERKVQFNHQLPLLHRSLILDRRDTEVAI